MTRRLLAAFAAAMFLAIPALAQGGPPSLMQPQPQGAEWYVAIGGQPQGPFTPDQIAGQHLSQETPVWRQGMDRWVPLGQVPELAAAADSGAAGGPPALSETRDTTEYFLAIGGAPDGPMSRDEVVRRIAGGAVDGTTLVWHEGMSDWAPLAETRLSALVERAPVASVPGPDGAGPSIVGTWQGQMEQAVDGAPTPVIIDIVVVYGESGQFSARGSGMLDLQQEGMPQPVRLEITLDGTWTGQAVDARRVQLGMRGSIRVAAPELGLEETDTFDETNLVEFVDADTVRDDEGYVMRRVQARQGGAGPTVGPAGRQ